MPSLTEHFRRREHHATLPFRADCPLCRLERMQGAPPRDDVVPASVQAGLLAAVLATSAAIPPAGALAAPGGNGGLSASGKNSAPPVSKGPRSSPPPAAEDDSEEASGSSSSAPDSIKSPERDPEIVRSPPRPEPRPEPRREPTDRTPRLERPSAPSLAPSDDGRSDPAPARSDSDGRGQSTGREDRGRDRGRDQGDDERRRSHGNNEDAPSAAPAPRIERPYTPEAPLFVPGRGGARRSARAADPVLERVEPRLAPTERKVVQVERELTQELGRPPTEGQIAKRAGLSEREVIDTRADVKERVRDARERLERPRTRTVADGGTASTYTVRSGDSLWSIADDQLAEGASDAQVAAAVEDVWHENEDRIASGDPDLIRPGERLAL